jgi:hypothetical protein
MIITILIVLVAVVVLIVIIAVLALHFLRADDSDTFDEVPDEPRRSRPMPADPPPAPRELAPAKAERGRPRRSEPAREPWAAERPVRAAADQPSSYRERDTGPRPAVPTRRDSQPSGQRPVAASARPAKSPKPARPADQDPKSSSWDSLSDVDYWAELSANRPQITPAAAAAAPTGPAGARRGPDAKPDARSATASRPAVRDENGQLPRRQRSQSGRGAAAAQSGRPAETGQTEQMDVRAARGSGGYGNEPATQSLAALARLGGQQSGSAPRPAGAQRPATGQRPASGQRPAAAPRPAGGQRPATGPRSVQPSLPSGPTAQVSQQSGRPRQPAPLDDDPLTSPSFPAVNTSDSRSYRTRRSPGGQSGPHTGPQPVNGRGNGGNGRYGEPTAQFSQYPASAQAHSQPIMQPPAPSAPVANPYGSYVSAPQPTYQDVAAARPDATAYANGYVGGWQADGTWYAGTVNNGAANNGAANNGAANNGGGNGDAASGYLPAPAYNGTDHAGNGYAPVDYTGVTYQGATYETGPAANGAPGSYVPQGNYAGQYDQRGYGPPDLGYGQDGYQAHPGYGTGGH